MRFTKTQAAHALLIVCPSARRFLQMAGMPPYAGLDEVYHVARLAFVRNEHRNPTTTEASIPLYLIDAIQQAHEPRGGGEPRLTSSAMPSMGEAAYLWPSIVAARG